MPNLIQFRSENSTYSISCIRKPFFFLRTYSSTDCRKSDEDQREDRSVAMPRPPPHWPDDNTRCVLAFFFRPEVTRMHVYNSPRCDNGPTEITVIERMRFEAPTSADEVVTNFIRAAGSCRGREWPHPNRKREDDREGVKKTPQNSSRWQKMVCGFQTKIKKTSYLFSEILKSQYSLVLVNETWELSFFHF